MKFLLDFFPLAFFVGTYFYSSSETPMYPAVQALMIATVIQTIGSRLLTGKFEKLHLSILGITLAFGTLTLVFRNPEFLQWKASIVVWLMAGVFLYRQYVSKKPLIQEMLGNAVEGEMNVPDAVWKNINMLWPIFYFLFGFLNLYVAFNFTEAFWVKFKLFGLMGLTMTLLVYTMVRLVPYFPEEEKSTDSDSETESAETDPVNKSQGE